MPRDQQLQLVAHDQELQHTDCDDPTYDCDEWGKKYKKQKNGMKNEKMR